MNERERVIKAIQHKNTDIIPYQLDLSSFVYEKLVKHFNDRDFLYNMVGNHLIREKNENNLVIDSRTYKDLFGVTWSKDQEGGDIGIVKEYILNEPVIERYTFPEPDAELIGNKCKGIIEKHKNLFKIYEIGFSLFERAWTLRGMEDLLVDFMLDEDFSNTLLDKILEYNLKAIDIAVGYSIDCIMFGDDWGQQRSLIMGPEVWRKYIKPRIAIMYERVKKHGLFVAQHSCGNNKEIFGDLIDVGLDIYNTFQPEIYNIKEFKKEYGGNITIYGGISTQYLLSKGTPLEVKKETKRMLNILGKNGGFVAAPTHEIPSDIPLENILAFIETVREQ